MSSTAKKVGVNLARVALLGFALEPLLDRKARAYYMIALAVVAGSTITSGATTAGGVVLLVWLVNENKEDEYQLDSSTRHLIDSALIAGEGDLGMQITLLSESPTAFAQLDREVSQGQGPALEALAAATGLPVERVAAGWTRARAVHPEVESPAMAGEVVSAFLVDLAPELEVDRQSHAELATSLVRERSAPDFPAGARTHTWLAGWLGVPVEAVGDATQATLAELPLVRGMDPRALLYASPDTFLTPFAARIEAEHKDEVEARVAALVKSSSEQLPAPTREALLASSTR